MTLLVGYLVLFIALAVFFVFIHLVIGKLVRPSRMNPEKATIYECGEPSIGSAWIQFDLRFYVIALLFVVFDVEVAFFFPWAVVFGQANALAKAEVPATDEEKLAYVEHLNAVVPPHARTPDQARLVALVERKQELTRELAAPGADQSAIQGSIHVVNDELNSRFEKVVASTGEAARPFAWIAFFDILVFFGVLLVGFAYLWKRGDLVWVRSTAAEQQAAIEEAAAPTPQVPAATAS